MKEQKDLGLDEPGIVEALEMIEVLTTGRDNLCGVTAKVWIKNPRADRA